MIGQCKYAFQMLRYAFGIKGNSVAAVILVIAGLVLEFISHGTNFLGSFFVVVLSMFPVQFLYSISLSNHVASSPYRKRLQTSMPALMNLTLNIGIFTLLNIINSTGIEEAAKQEAIQEMIDLTELSEKENAAETLLMAKGFLDPVVSISSDKVDVIVNAASITDAQRAQIEDVVKRKTEMAADSIIITLLNLRE